MMTRGDGHVMGRNDIEVGGHCGHRADAGGRQKVVNLIGGEGGMSQSLLMTGAGGHRA